MGKDYVHEDETRTDSSYLSVQLSVQLSVSRMSWNNLRKNARVFLLWIPKAAYLWAVFISPSQSSSQLLYVLF